MSQVKFVPTSAFADLVGMKQQSLRAAYCKHGHWCGIRPVKLPNRRLLWPVEAAQRIIGEAA